MTATGASLDQAVTIADAAVYRAHAVGAGGPVRAGAGRGPGVLMPAAYAARHPWERAYAHAECLLEATVDTVIHVRARWLQLTARTGWQTHPVGPGGTGRRPTSGSGRVRAGSEVTLDPRTADAAEFLPRDVGQDVTLADLLAARIDPPPSPSGGWSRGWLPHPSAARPSPWEPGASLVPGRPAGGATSHIVRLSAPPGRRVRESGTGDTRARIAWDTWSAHGELRLSAAIERGGEGLVRLRAELVNTSGWQPRMDDAIEWTAASSASSSRRRALRHALIGAHVILGLDEGDGVFLSLSAPPERARTAAQGCVNDGLWPALIGGHGIGRLLLISPIHLPDNPVPRPTSVAPTTKATDTTEAADTTADTDTTADADADADADAR